MDSKQAIISVSYFVFITLRPLCILIGIVLRSLLFRANHLALQAMKFQASLDAFTIGVEISVIFTIILIYLLRRYIRSKRYVPRFQAFVHKKQQAILTKYMMVIDRIAQTSILLANILPHALYILIVVVLHWTWWGRSAIRFFSVKLPALQIMTVWIPAIQTVLSVAQYKHWYNSNKVHRKGEMKEESSARAKSSKKASAAQPSLPSTLEVQLQELLMYWIVFSVFTAVSSFMTFLPFVSSLIFPQHDGLSQSYSSQTDASGEESSTMLARISLAFSIMTSWWNQRGLFLRDLQLLFLLWAWIFSALAKANNVARSTPEIVELSKGITSPSAIKKAKKAASSWYMMSPLNFLYLQVNSFFLKRFIQEGDRSPLIEALYTNLDSFLQLAVLVKLIRPPTKAAIVRVVKQGSHYIPSLVTLVMPGYFTSLGIIYASYIVSSGYSSKLLNSSNSKSIRAASFKNMELSDLDPIIFHLQYYVVLLLGINTLWSTFYERVILSTPLFRYILYWVPFQFHIRLLLILWLQVPLMDGESILYNFLEQELVLFGIVRGDYTTVCHLGAFSVDHDGHQRKPLIARVFGRLMELIPTSNDVKSIEGATSSCQIRTSEKDKESFSEK